ncbi:MAG: hypothetical protein JRN62_05900 [Nitrososphaerota archaeon]|nr:hypothetical protein [Nitrososphaerota archaeon]
MEVKTPLQAVDFSDHFILEGADLLVESSVLRVYGPELALHLSPDALQLSPD